MSRSPSISLDVRSIRQKTGLNQTDFWSVLGVTQSGGSRYECQEGVPEPVLLLLDVTYIKSIDIQALKKGDGEILAYLRANPVLLEKIKIGAKAHAKEVKRLVRG